MSKEYFNPSRRHNLHFHENFGNHDCPAQKCRYEVFERSGVRIVYCKNCSWAMKTVLDEEDK